MKKSLRDAKLIFIVKISSYTIIVPALHSICTASLQMERRHFWRHSLHHKNSFKAYKRDPPCLESKKKGMNWFGTAGSSLKSLHTWTRKVRRITRNSISPSRINISSVKFWWTHNPKTLDYPVWSISTVPPWKDTALPVRKHRTVKKDRKWPVCRSERNRI